LGRIIRRLDGVSVSYQLRFSAQRDRRLAGWGNLRVKMSDGLVWCRVAGEVFRPSDYEFAFHSFWLTRRGMIQVVAGLLEERKPQERCVEETFIQPVLISDRALKSQAAQCLKRRRNNAPNEEG
jgi:hypothetical protein